MGKITIRQAQLVWPGLSREIYTSNYAERRSALCFFARARLYRVTKVMEITSSEMSHTFAVVHMATLPTWVEALEMACGAVAAFAESIVIALFTVTAAGCRTGATFPPSGKNAGSMSC